MTLSEMLMFASHLNIVHLPPLMSHGVSYCFSTWFVWMETDANWMLFALWLRSTVGGTPVFGRRTDPILRSACS